MQLFFYPDYRANNHYQSMLYSKLDSETNALSGSIEEAISHAENNRHEIVVFHLHWPEPIFAGVTDPDAFRFRAELFIAKLKALQHLGGRVLWTLHNRLPHDIRFEQTYIWFHQQLADHVDRVLLHSLTAVEIVAPLYRIDLRKIAVIPHGSYIDIYSNTVSRIEARARFNINETSFVFGFVGQLRPYKGLDSLVTAFARLRSLSNDINLLIAGKAVHPTKPGEWTGMQNVTQGLIVDERYIPTEELQYYMAASDVIVLPYNDILTSGSALLAASFHKPMIIPNLKALRDVINTGSVISYDRHDPEGLFGALQTATQLHHQEILEMQNAATKFANMHSWSGIAQKFSDLLRHVDKPVTSSTDINGSSIDLRRPPQIVKGGVAIAVVDYFSQDDTITLVENLPTHVDDIPICPYVLDNSEDDLVFDHLCRSLPQAVILRSSQNIGYAAGNNTLLKIIEHDKREFVFILNPDVRINEETLRSLIQESANDKLSLLSPIVLNEAGDISFAGAFFTEGLDFEVSHFLAGKPIDSAPKQAYTVDALNGCSLFFRTTLLRDLGPIPEEYFLYFEETEWFRRAKNKGITAKIIPNSQAVHNKVSHGSGLPTLYYLYYFVRGSALFALALGRSVDSSQQRLRSDFIAGWRKRIKNQNPQFERIFESTVLAALDDGKQLVQGKIDLGSRIDQVAISQYLSTKGFVEEISFSNRTIVGWIDGGSERLTETSANAFDGVWLIVNDVPKVYCEVSINRTDVLEAGHRLKSGFAITLPPDLFNGSLLTIEVRSASSGVRLPFTMFAYESRVKIRFSPSTVLENPMKLEGRVEGIKDGKLNGWVWDKGNPDRAVSVDIKIGDEVFSIGPAEIFRSDLRRAGKGNGSHVFEVLLPNRFLSRGEITVTVLKSGTDEEVTKRKVVVPKDATGFDKNWSLSEFLPWAYLEDKMPVGVYESATRLRHDLGVKEGVHACRARQIEPRKMVSIIMPMYNRERVVLLALESVKAQTYTNWELIVIDDCSQDDSIGVVRGWIARNKHLNVRLLEHKINRGVSAARNTGLQDCTGEYIAYLDSDNTWKDETVSIMVHALIKSLNAITAYAGQIIWEYIPLLKTFEERFVRLSPFNVSRLERKNFIDLNVFFHHRSCLERYGYFNEEMRRLVDWELIIRYTSEIPPAFVPCLLSNYYVNAAPNQITRVENYKNAIDGIYRTLKEQFRFLKDNQGTQPKNNLVVILRVNTSSTVDKWISMNVDWLNDGKIDIISWNLNLERECVQRVSNLEAVIKYREAVETEIINIDDSLSADVIDLASNSDLIVVDSDLAVEGGWRLVVHKAEMVYGQVVTTGRKMPLISGLNETGTTVDQTPGICFRDVVRWDNDSSMHFIPLKRLSGNLMTIPKSVSYIFVICLLKDRRPDLVTSTFFSEIEAMSDVTCAYLPDMKAYSF